jgi:uncharacterized protein (DUF362 family)
MHSKDSSTGSSTHRRDFIKTGLVLSAGFIGIRERLAALEPDELPPLPALDRRSSAATSPVVVERAADFEIEKLAKTMESMFDRLGGIGKLVSGKTVTVKLNTTGGGEPMRGRPAARSYQTHPNQVEALVGILHRAGAKRICLVESFYRKEKPEAIYERQGWNIERIHSASGRTTAFEDTRNRGAFSDYAKVEVPWGGFAFPAYHLNRRYVETDVLISIAKMKEHITAGVTGAVKNLFGIVPTSLYGNDAPNEDTVENRGDILHHKQRRVPAGVTEELHPLREPLAQPTESYFRVPCVTADLFGARPVDLAIVEGIETCKGGEGPWCPRTRPVAPGLLIAGRNAVCVDAVMTVLMGLDPKAGTRETPWYGYNHLDLLARAGIGTNDPARIEIIGTPLRDAVFRFQPEAKGWLDRDV